MPNFFSPPSGVLFDEIQTVPINAGNASNVGDWTVDRTSATPPGGAAQAHGMPAPDVAPSAFIAASTGAPPGQLVCLRSFSEGSTATIDVAIHNVDGRVFNLRIRGDSIDATAAPRIVLVPNADATLLFVYQLAAGNPNRTSSTHFVIRTDTGDCLALASDKVTVPYARAAFVDTAAWQVGIGLSARATPRAQADLGFLLDQQPLPQGRPVCLPLTLTIEPWPTGGVKTKGMIVNEGTDLLSLRGLSPTISTVSFTFQQPLPVLLQPGESWQFEVGATAPHVNSYLGELAFQTCKGLDSSPIGVESMSSGSKGRVQLFPDTLRFSPGTAGSVQSVQIVNNGATALTLEIDASPLNVPFSWPNLPQRTLAPGESTQLDVTFTDIGSAPSSVPIKLSTPTGPYWQPVAVQLVANQPRKPRLGDFVIPPFTLDPPGRDVQNEVVVVVNRSGEIIDLGDCKIHDHGDRNSLSLGGLLAGPQFNVWTRQKTNADPGLPTDVYFNRARIAVWNNDGDTAYLVDANGVELARRTMPQPAIPVLPPPQRLLLDERIVPLNASDDWLNTLVFMQTGDELVFEEWSNFIANPNRSGPNDPQWIKDPAGQPSQAQCGWNFGWHTADGDARSLAPQDDAWPMPGEPKFMVVGGVVSGRSVPLLQDRFTVGESRNLDPVDGDYPAEAGALCFRINDDYLPDNNGSFKIHFLRYLP